MNKVLVLLIVFLIAGIGTAFAGDGLQVDIGCPTSVSYGSGTTTLNATVYLKNWDCTNSVSVQRYMTAIVAIYPCINKAT